MDPDRGPGAVPGPRHRVPAWRRNGRLGADLLLPGAVTVVLVTPALSLGALAAVMRSDFALTATDLGTLFALFFVCSAICASAGDRVASRFPATTIVRTAVLSSSLVCALIALAHSKPVLLVGCLVAGSANGLAAPALNMLIFWLVPPARHGLAFGVRVAAAPATSTLAALAAFGLASVGWRWEWFYWGAAVLGCAVAVQVSRASQRDPGVSVIERSGPPRSRAPRSLRLLALGGLLGATASTVIAPFLVVSLVDRGQDASRAVTLLALGSWLAIGGRLGAGVISDWWPTPLNHIRGVALMLLACGAGMAVLSRDAADGTLVVAVLVAMGLGWCWPGLLHHAVITTHSSSPTRATSLMQTGTYLGSVAGPLVFGLTADRLSFSLAWTTSACIAAFAASALFAGVALLRRQPSPIGQ